VSIVDLYVLEERAGDVIRSGTSLLFRDARVTYLANAYIL
jgi:hypothetical protein